MAFTIKKAYFLGLGNWLNDLSLTGSASRARTRFVEQLQAQLQIIDKDRVAILETHADKNEDGTPKKEAGDNGEHYVLSEEASKAVAKEYSELLMEDYVLDITDANRLQMESLRKIVLESDYRFGPREGDSPEIAQIRIRQMNDYPAWCDAFEAI